MSSVTDTFCTKHTNILDTFCIYFYAKCVDKSTYWVYNNIINSTNCTDERSENNEETE